MKRNTALLNRFGYGIGTDEPISWKETQAWLSRQVDPQATSISGQQLEVSSVDVVARVGAAKKESKMARKEVRKALAVQSVADAKASLYRAIHSPTPFAERWVQFWLNHFTISTVRKEVQGLTGAFEREVIRAHCFGRFSDLLLHATRHPAMLIYLDNIRSVGPTSAVGKKNRGLNENLAREILELHTVGPQGGYVQSDIEQFARLLTGWSVNRGQAQSNSAFYFRGKAHEPGQKKVLGVWYPEGESGGVRCLRDLAGLHQTAVFVATKLARHFVSNFPSKDLVNALTQRFQATNGDLREMAHALLQHPDAQMSQRPKVRTPFEWIVGMAKVRPGAVSVDDAFRAVRQLDQVPFTAPSPKGWSEDIASWIGPEATLDRLDVAERFGRRMSAVAEETSGVLDGWLHHATENTRSILQSAQNPIHMWALMVLSPEFQRR